MNNSPPMENKHKSLVIITGASRGIGRAIALAIADAVKESTLGDDESPAAAMLSAPLRMVLIARSAESLQETARLVEQRGSAVVTTTCHEMDLSDLDTLPNKLQQILEPLSGEQYDTCLLINNAGSLGPLGLASSSSGESDMKELRKAVDFNVTSSIWVSSQFTKTFLTSASCVRIVNISSLCAIKPFPTMSTYCACKGGRDMFHLVLAKEHSTKSNENNKEANNEDDRSSQKPKQVFKTLNYAPGACDTVMTDNLAECSVLDDGLHEYFSSSKQENKLIRPEDTAKKLVKLLSSDEYESGNHVDYWDV